MAANDPVDAELLKKAEEEKEEEKTLKELKFYHGYLPREDLLFVLKNEGDYLLRVSEVGSGDKTVEPDMMNKRAIILSVLVDVHLPPRLHLQYWHPPPPNRE
ncbi:hypothetical protein OSTOST_25581, partial [Ostertagia ostertagi]